MYTQRDLYRAGSAAKKDSARTTVEAADNHIYFYADVDSDHCLELVRAIRDADSKLRAQHLTRGLEGMPPTPVWLHINSYGGDLFAGFGTADQLALIKSPVHSIVEGICASAATLIALSCTRRYILWSSFVLIHQLSAFVWGTHEEFKDEMNLQNKAMDRLVEFYTAHSKVTPDELRAMLTRDFWMDAETSVKLGFTDEILQ